jgi:hypothetical protein
LDDSKTRGIFPSEENNLYLFCHERLCLLRGTLILEASQSWHYGDVPQGDRYYGDVPQGDRLFLFSECNRGTHGFLFSVIEHEKEYPIGDIPRKKNKMRRM